MIQRTFVVSFRTSTKSDMGAELFEQMIKAAVWAGGQAKSYTTNLCSLDCSLREAKEILEKSGVRVEDVDPIHPLPSY